MSDLPHDLPTEFELKGVQMPATLNDADQYIRPAYGNNPNNEEMKDRVAAMATITKAGIDVDTDDIGAAIKKLDVAGIRGEQIPQSAHQIVAHEYLEAARQGNEHALVENYQSSKNPNLNLLLDAYVMESKLRDMAKSTLGRDDQTLEQHPERYQIVIERAQHNIALDIQQGGGRISNELQTTQPERDQMLAHLMSHEYAHADSTALQIHHTDRQQDAALDVGLER